MRQPGRPACRQQRNAVLTVAGPGAPDSKAGDREKGRKQVLLRLNASLWQELAAWAEDDFRSINGQIEYLLHEAVKRRKEGRRGE